MLLVVGLGNPGARYARNRHNAGFEIVSALADHLRAPSWRDKFHGEFTRCEAKGTELLLLRPMTFMNDSGRSVRAATQFFKVEASELLVVHDELDLEFGILRLKQGGGHAGHNGLRSLFEQLGSGDFARLRCGIGRPPRGWSLEVADWVLSDFASEERAQWPDVLKQAVKALVLVADKGLAAATNALNTRPKKPRPADPAPADPTTEQEGLAKGNK
jgi:PTH1 family peptidyl-tRNA hydrolase